MAAQDKSTQETCETNTHYCRTKSYKRLLMPGSYATARHARYAQMRDARIKTTDDEPFRAHPH